MLTDIAPALVALFGILVSVSVSYIIAIRQARIETQQLRTEIQQNYAGKLFEKRLDVYPELFSNVSSVIQKINFGEVTGADFTDLFSKARDWEAKNSILFSAHLQQVSYETVLMLHKWTEMDTEEQQKIPRQPEGLKEMRKNLQQLELALKNDLGVYSLDSPNVITSFDVPVSYRNVDELAKKKAVTEKD